MEFIEMSGLTLLDVVTDAEITPADLAKAGVVDHSIVRINRQGDIELRRKNGWDVIGGLLGNFEERLKKTTHLDWAG